MLLPQIALVLLIMSAITHQFLGLQTQAREADLTANAAAHFAQVTQATASRVFELGSRVLVETGYAAGAPPGVAGSMDWLKNPATCGIPTIPALPSDEAGNPVDDSFLPCDFADTDIWGNGYGITWTLIYPGTRATIVVGAVPFTVGGVRRDDIGGAMALKAQSYSLAGIGDSTLDLIINYDFDPATSTLSAVIDRSAGFAADPHLRIDGTNEMDAAAPIRWANGMSITPNGTTMEIVATGGINLLNDTDITGDLGVTGDMDVSTGDVSMNDGTLESVQIEGAFDAQLSRAVYDQRINQSGDVVDQPTCPTGMNPQIFVAAASVPTGDAMIITDSGGATHTGNVIRFRTTAVDLGAQWQVWAEVFMNSSWVRLAAAEGDVRSSIKCT